MSHPILIKNTRDPLAGLTKEEFERRLSLAVTGRVREAWLFGSYVCGALGPDSDIDIILVTETQESFTNRSWQFADLLDIGPRLDILVYTPEEFRRLVEHPTDGFWKNITTTMRLLVLQ
jgi:predicted nucleotidyltransferase